MRGPKFLVALCLATLPLVSCGGGSSSSSSTTSTPTATASASPSVTIAPTDCVNRIIDYGQKGNVAAVARGVYSDTKIIPGTSYPATAYSDPGAISLKFTYWSGTSFGTEIISGEGAATFVRLAFLSTAVPIVLWAQGINLKAAVRSQPVGTAGVWNVGIIDTQTGRAPRAIEVSVNPLDQVAVSYLTDSAATGRAAFSYCNSPCTTPAGFFTMTPNIYIENTNLIANEVSTGVGWCKSSSTVYYPAMVYSVAGPNTQYAICQNSLSACLLNTNWTTQSVINTSSLSSKLHLDSTVTGDVPKVVSLGAGGITTYKMGAVACTSAPAAFSAGAVLGGATSGSQWMSLLKGSNGKFALLANESTTSVRYYNSTTTDINGAWNAFGLIDTTTLAAAHQGGADMNTLQGTIYASYGQNVAPFDIKLAQVSDYTVASNSAVTTRAVPDVSGDLQLSAATSQQKLVSVASTSAGIPAIAYVDFSVGAVGSAKLKYAFRSGSNSSSSWSIQQIPGTTNPQFPSLAFDQSNKPWIAYFDASPNRFFLASNSSTDGSGTWRTYEFPATPGGAPSNGFPTANNTALAMYNSGSTSKPVMVVIDNFTATKGVKASTLDPTLNSWSTVVTVDALSGATGGAHLSSDFNSSGSIVIAYQDTNSARARYARTIDAGATWSTPLAVSALNQGMGVTVRINPKTGSPALAYLDRANNALYYAPCTGTVTACASSGWSPVAVDQTLGISGLAAGNEQLLSAALNFDSAGTAYIAYPKGQGTTGNLTLVNNSSGTFTSQVLASGANGSTPGTAAALNFGVAGWGVAIAPNAANSVVTAFIGPGNYLYSASCGD